MLLGAKLINLIAAAAGMSATASAAPIDTKTEHLGFKLGSMRSELTAKVLQETQQLYQFQFAKLPPNMQAPKEYVLQIQPPHDASFGGLKVQAITLAYLSNRLCAIHLEFEHVPYLVYNDAVETFLEGLKQKYGPPTQYRYPNDGKGSYNRLAYWQGDDIGCTFDEFPGAFETKIPAQRLGITLMSKFALQKAEEEAVRKFGDEQLRIRQKAKDVQGDL